MVRKEISSDKNWKDFRETALWCEFFSRSYNVLFIEHFAHSLFMEYAIGYFGALWSIWWQRKYPKTKTRKKLSQKPLSYSWIRLTDLQFPFMEQLDSTVFGESAKGYFGVHWGLWWERKYPLIKIKQKFSEKVVGDVRIHLRELHCSFPWAVF